MNSQTGSQTLTEEPMLSAEEIQAAYQILSAPLSDALIDIIDAPGVSETIQTHGNTRQTIYKPIGKEPAITYYESRSYENNLSIRRFNRTHGYDVPWRKGTNFKLLLAEGEKPEIFVNYEETSPSDQRAIVLQISPAKSDVFVAGNVRFGQTFAMCWVEYLPSADPFSSNGDFHWQIQNLKLFPYTGLFETFGRLVYVEPLPKTNMFGTYPRQKASELILNPTFGHDYLQTLILKMIKGELDQDLGAFLPGFVNVRDQKNIWDVSHTLEPIANLEFI